MNIALTQNFDLKWKYEMLETIDLDIYQEALDLSAKDVLNRVETFLDDVETQKQRDLEEFDAIRTGAIDDIWNAEYGCIGGSLTPASSSSMQSRCSEVSEDDYSDREEGSIESSRPYCLVNSRKDSIISWLSALKP